MPGPDHLEAIIDRAIDAGLFDDRAALLRHLPNRVRGEMPLLDRPADLLRSDLTFLHGLPSSLAALLIGWLKAATGITQGSTRDYFAQQARHFEDLHPPPGLRIRWRFAVNTPPLGEVRLPANTGPVVLGRRHLGQQPSGFVPLISAPWRVSPRHVGIEVLSDGQRIKRFGKAGMLGCDGWLKVGESRVVGREATLDLAGALQVTVELT